MIYTRMFEDQKNILTVKLQGVAAGALEVFNVDLDLGNDLKQTLRQKNLRGLYTE